MPKLSIATLVLLTILAPQFSSLSTSDASAGDLVINEVMTTYNQEH